MTRDQGPRKDKKSGAVTGIKAPSGKGSVLEEETIDAVYDQEALDARYGEEIELLSEESIDTIDAVYDEEALNERYNEESPDLRSTPDKLKATDEKKAPDETGPEEIYRCEGLELVRWPLMEKVELVLDTQCLHVLRGRLLTLLRSGEKETSIPLRDIVSVVFADGSPSVTFTMQSGGTLTLHGDGGITLAAILWTLGIPGSDPKESYPTVALAHGDLLTTGPNRPGTLAIGPAGVAYAPEGWLAQVSGGGSLRFLSNDLRSASVEGGRTLVLSTETTTTRFECSRARKLLQAMRVVLAATPPCPPESMEEDGSATAEYVAERLARLADLEPPLPEMGELLFATQALWTPDKEHTAWALLILGSAHVIVLPDDPAIAPHWIATGRARRGDLPEDLFAGGAILRVAERQVINSFRIPAGQPFVRRFWAAVQPYYFVVPEEDFHPDQWSGIPGPSAFVRFTTEQHTETLFRPAMTIQRKDGLRLVLREDDSWPFDQGEFLRAEVSRPRGVFRFTVQYLRMEKVEVVDTLTASTLGVSRDDALRFAVLMPGPNPPELLPPKRKFLRLPTDEDVRVIVPIAPSEEEPEDSNPTASRAIMGRLADLSAGGCAIQIDEEFPIGMTLQVIPDGGTSQETFSVEVMQVRVVPEAARLLPDLTHELGLRFKGLNESRVSWLQRGIMQRQRTRVASLSATEAQEPDTLPMLDRPYHP